MSDPIWIYMGKDTFLIPWDFPTSGQKQSAFGSTPDWPTGKTLWWLVRGAIMQGQEPVSSDIEHTRDDLIEDGYVPAACTEEDFPDDAYVHNLGENPPSYLTGEVIMHSLESRGWDPDWQMYVWRYQATITIERYEYWVEPAQAFFVPILPLVLLTMPLLLLNSSAAGVGVSSQQQQVWRRRPGEMPEKITD